MSQLTTVEYDLLESALARGRRLAFVRRGRTVVAVPLRLELAGRSEVVEARLPSTGELIELSLDTVERIEEPR
ncbi:MAG: hypothetical protein ACT4OZ_00930 [Gemmatimonadota bacterium]